MRVITGSARGRRLKEPANYDIRPTTDKVKEAMFNIVQFQLEDARVLDLFAGTGQLGIEALSRGAASCVFVDKSTESLQIVRENLAVTGLLDKAQITRTDSLQYLKSGQTFDVIFLDPPYALDLLEKAVESIAAFDILRENGIMVCESERDKVLPDLPADKFAKREYHYSRIKLTTYSKVSP